MLRLKYYQWPLIITIMPLLILWIVGTNTKQPDSVTIILLQMQERKYKMCIKTQVNNLWKKPFVLYTVLV